MFYLFKDNYLKNDKTLGIEKLNDQLNEKLKIIQ